MQLVVRGGDQAGVVGFGHGAALAFAAAVDADPVEEPAAGAGLVAGHARRRHPPGALPGHPPRRGAAAAAPRCGPSAGAGSARPRPRSTDTPRSPPLASKLDPGHVPPRGDRCLIALGGAVHRDLRGVADPVQQIRGAPQGVADMEQPADQRGRPAPASTAGPRPSPTPPGPHPARPAAGPAAPGSAGTPPRPRPSRPARPRRRPASAAATDTPTWCSPAAGAPPAPGYMSCSNIAAACSRTLLPPGPPRSGQATTIGISHTSRRRPATAPITQARRL